MRDGAIRFGLMLMVFSIISQNILWLNSKFLSQLPVGYILLICFGIFIIRHVCRTLKWYSVWLKYGTKQKLEKLLIHICLYLIVISVALSVPNLNLSVLTAAITTMHADKTPLPDLEVTLPEPEVSLPKSETPDTAPVASEPMDSEMTKESKPTITSSTLWVDYNTYAVGGDGHTIKLMQNSTAKDPTFQEMLNFLRADQTDKNDYLLDKFVCADFAEQVQNNAEMAGYNCAYVTVMFTDGVGHACNAFNTTDRGLVFIDCTNSLEGRGPYNSDCIVNITEGSVYKPRYLFNNNDWYTLPMGTVESYRVYWD